MCLVLVISDAFRMLIHLKREYKKQNKHTSLKHVFACGWCVCNPQYLWSHGTKQERRVTSAAWWRMKAELLLPTTMSTPTQRPRATSRWNGPGTTAVLNNRITTTEVTFKRRDGTAAANTSRSVRLCLKRSVILRSEIPTSPHCKTSPSRLTLSATRQVFKLVLQMTHNRKEEPSLL